MAETILIELVVDDSQLQPAIDLLEKTGQIDSKLANSFRQTTAEVNKQAAAIKNDNAALAAMQKNFDQLAKELKEQNQFLLGFKEGIEDALKSAGVTIEEFFEALKNGPPAAEPKVESLKSKLRGLTEQLAVLKANGQDNTEQFQKIAAEAGRLQDAIGDARQEVKNLASDTGTFDGLISAAQGIAGGFAVAQGAAALFGDESEELQKTLLKVNAIMAILQGLQQIQNVLQRESAAVRLLDTIATKGQIAAQTLFAFVVGTSTGALKAFRIALASTGIGLLVIALIEAAKAIQEFAIGTREAVEAQKRLNNAVAETNKALVNSNDIYVQSLGEQKKVLQEQLALAEARGESEVRLLELRRQISQEEGVIGKKSLENLGLTRLGVERLDSQYTRLIQRIVTLNEVAQQDTSKRGQEAAEELRARLQAEADGIKPLLDAGLQAIKQIDEAQRDSALLAIEIQKQKAKSDKEDQLRRLADELAALERRLLAAEKGSERELRIEQAIISKKAEIELAGEKLTQNQRLLIRDKALNDNLEKERAFNEKLAKEQIDAQISRNNAELSNVQIQADDKLRLSISNIELQAQLEIQAANSNSEKIKEIIAKRNADIAALTASFIQQQAQQEIDRINVREGVESRALQRLANNEKQSARTRIVAIQQLAEKELDSIAVRERALDEQKRKALINEQDYNDQYAKLQDDKAKISEDTEKKITDIHASETEKRKQRQAEFIQSLVEVAQSVLDIVGQLNDLRTQQDQERLEGERARVQELLENGAITEKEAIARNKRIDAEEKKLKAQAAQRDKNLAIFNAVINTAAAITKALPNLVLAGIAAALGAAQIAIIASRPIPKFKGGKKNRYRGPGIIGEDGAEIFEHDGKRYVAYKETLVWLGKDDKVYTPQETKRMLPQVDRELMKPQPDVFVSNDIDYDQLAKAVGKEVGKHVKVPGISIDEHGFKAYMEDGISRTRYMDKYYSSK